MALKVEQTDGLFGEKFNGEEGGRIAKINRALFFPGGPGNGCR